MFGLFIGVGNGSGKQAVGREGGWSRDWDMVSSELRSALDYG